MIKLRIPSAIQHIKDIYPLPDRIFMSLSLLREVIDHCLGITDAGAKQFQKKAPPLHEKSLPAVLQTSHKRIASSLTKMGGFRETMILQKKKKTESTAVCQVNCFWLVGPQRVGSVFVLFFVFKWIAFIYIFFFVIYHHLEAAVIQVKSSKLIHMVVRLPTQPEVRLPDSPLSPHVSHYQHSTDNFKDFSPG